MINEVKNLSINEIKENDVALYNAITIIVSALGYSNEKIKNIRVNDDKAEIEVDCYYNVKEIIRITIQMSGYEFKGNYINSSEFEGEIGEGNFLFSKTKSFSNFYLLVINNEFGMPLQSIIVFYKDKNVFSQAENIKRPNTYTDGGENIDNMKRLS